jgi:hypothetical protein
MRNAWGFLFTGKVLSVENRGLLPWGWLSLKENKHYLTRVQPVC